MARLSLFTLRRCAAQMLRIFPLSWPCVLLLLRPLAADDQLLSENFERPKDTAFYRRLREHPHLQIASRAGVDRGHALRATYLGSQDGSERIIVTEPLSRGVSECTLCYDLKFEKGFQFVQGGRLHGVGPDNRVLGERPDDPDAWCARIRFRRDGTLQTSTYHQDQRNSAGDRGQRLTPIKLLPERFYAISLHVRLNDPEQSNGLTRLYVNGTLVEERVNIRFRKVDGDSSLIKYFLFSTAHTGHSRQDAPRNLDGSYAACTALFDNLVVYAGEHIRKNPGWDDPIPSDEN